MSETGVGFAMGGWFEHTQENCAKKRRRISPPPLSRKIIFSSRRDAVMGLPCDGEEGGCLR